MKEKAREEEDQGKDQRVDRDPDFVQIRKLIFLREKKSIPKRTVPD